MPSLRVITDGVGAWPDLDRRAARHKLVEVPDTAMEIACLPQGMQSGRASVAFRIDLPDGRVVFIQSSLRALHAATAALVAKHGEPFMQHPLSDREHKLALSIVDLVRQLTDAKERLGEKLELNFETGDATWDREQQLQGALQRARAFILAADSAQPGNEQGAVLDAIDRALTGRKP